MFGLREFYSQQEQLNEFRREAQAWRLAQTARAGRRVSFGYSVLAWLGRRLSRVGQRLEMQYGA